VLTGIFLFTLKRLLVLSVELGLRFLKLRALAVLALLSVVYLESH